MKAHALTTLLLCGALLFSFSGCASAPDAEPSSAESAAQEEISPDEPYRVDFRLTTGHHIAGVDFPAGVYHIEAVQWSGNVKSSNGAIDLDMGTSQHNMDGQNRFVAEADGIELPTGTRLSLRGGVRVRMICEDADTTPLTAREQSITESFPLSAGTYTAGEDFPAGTYDITATDGVGNVESSNMHDGGICEVMGTTWRIAEGFDFCEQNCKHIDLPVGTTLSISGVELYLTPSK